ncbi:MAG: YncE family protein [Bacteroidota bacterium]
MRIPTFIASLLFYSVFLPFELQSSSRLKLVQTIPLPDVAGRIDHIAYDPMGGRLFIAALGNNSVEVVDLQQAKRLQSIGGFVEPQGILFLPDSNRLVVANGGDGTCNILDGNTYTVLKRFTFNNDADNLRYDADAGKVYLGFGTGSLAIIDPLTWTHESDIGLTGHPEAFAIESIRHRIFVNIPTINRLAIIDLAGKVILKRTHEDLRDNYSLALDENSSRLYIGYRTPPRLLILDTDSLKEIALLKIPHDADDIFIDPVHHYIFVSSGEGYIAVIEQKDPRHYQIAELVPTSEGARTALFIPQLNRYYLAVPKHGVLNAEIRVYEIVSDDTK